MVRMIPLVAEEACFALKGGTAINFFVRDLLRLSVDIDLTYLPVEGRTPSLDGIAAALDRIADRITRLHPEVRVHRATRPNATRTVKLVVQGSTAQVKIEPNEVTRGVIFPSEVRNLSPKAEALFEMAAAINTVSLPDLYGGKLCAALDRQHPRDLFDVKLLLDAEGITDEIRNGFIAALLSHPRPIAEVFSPKPKDQPPAFDGHFGGMAFLPFTYDDYEATRQRLVAQLGAALTADDKALLLSFKAGEPDWKLSGMAELELMPAVQFKLANI